mmetsp:Transcript_33231/g.112795  ORF Transcript_33231/g.112795 Transcript_33231/m.112795 type:complete len:256 (+) Transcript_33231:2225-2992(+)
MRRERPGLGHVRREGSGAHGGHRRRRRRRGREDAGLGLQARAGHQVAAQEVPRLRREPAIDGRVARRRRRLRRRVSCFRGYRQPILAVPERRAPPFGGGLPAVGRVGEGGVRGHDGLRDLAGGRVHVRRGRRADADDDDESQRRRDLRVERRLKYFEAAARRRDRRRDDRCSVIGSGCAGHNKKTCKKQTCSCAWKKGTCAATNKKTCKKNKKNCVWKQPTCQVKEEFCGAFSTKSACKKQRKTCKWKKRKCLAK